MLIGLTGRKRAGKDTAARYLVQNYRFRSMAFADPLREAALALDPIVDPESLYTSRLSEVVERYGWEQAKDELPEVRRTLQRLGTEVVRDRIRPNAWIDLLRERVEEVRDKDMTEHQKHPLHYALDPELTPIVITDVRFENEADLITELGGSVVEIHRPGHNPAVDHSSEQGVGWDYQVDNVTDSPEVMYRDLDRLVNFLR